MRPDRSETKRERRILRSYAALFRPRVPIAHHEKLNFKRRIEPRACTSSGSIVTLLVLSASMRTPRKAVVRLVSFKTPNRLYRSTAVPLGDLGRFLSMKRSARKLCLSFTAYRYYGYDASFFEQRRNFTRREEKSKEKLTTGA